MKLLQAVMFPYPSAASPTKQPIVSARKFSSAQAGEVKPSVSAARVSHHLIEDRCARPYPEMLPRWHLPPT
jgi:hypothetical protein